MASKVKYPIRSKLIFLMSGFSLLTTIVYLVIAFQLFKDDKTQLIYELNLATVKTLSAQVEADLLKITDKVKLLTQGYQNESWARAVFETEPSLITYSLYRFQSLKSSWEAKTVIQNSTLMKGYGLSSADVDEIRKQTPIQFEKIIQNRVSISNSSFRRTDQGGFPVLTIALYLEITESGEQGSVRVPSIAVVDLKIDRIVSLLEGRKLASVYIVDSEGSVIAHPDSEKILAKRNLSDTPVVKDALSSPLTLEMRAFEWQGSRWLSAFSRVDIVNDKDQAALGAKPGMLFVISQIPEAEAFRALSVLLKKSLLFGLIVITCSLLVARWWAKNLTEPLKKLLDATDRLSRWQFDDSIHVKTKDEIAELAKAFNSMANDLQSQRNQLARHQEELERKVIERTSELEAQKRKLSETQEALLRTTRLASLGELAGTAAHEVLNPINNMNIRVEKVLQQLETEEKQDLELLTEIITTWKNSFTSEGWDGLGKELQKPSQEQGKSLGQEDLENLFAIGQDLSKRRLTQSDDMTFLRKEMTRITRIVNSMRSLSRVGGERRPIDIHVPIEEALVTVLDALGQRKIQLIRNFSPEPRERFFIVGDKDELLQVFSNLLRNSVQALVESGKRAGAIEISTIRNKDKIEIRISDNGTGIKKENLPKLFETKFTTKTLEEGTGLGLSICRRLVRAFGGDIVLERTIEGEGTTFLIWFPEIS